MKETEEDTEGRSEDLLGPTDISNRIGVTEHRTEIHTSGVRRHQDQIGQNGDEDRRYILGKLASDIEMMCPGFKFDSVPDRIYGGMPYTTPYELADKVTRYSQRYILTLVRRNEIPAYYLANQVVLDPEGVRL